MDRELGFLSARSRDRHSPSTQQTRNPESNGCQTMAQWVDTETISKFKSEHYLYTNCFIFQACGKVDDKKDRLSG